MLEKKLCSEVPDLTEMVTKETQLGGIGEKFLAVLNQTKNRVCLAGSLIPHRLSSIGYKYSKVPGMGKWRKVSGRRGKLGDFG